MARPSASTFDLLRWSDVPDSAPPLRTPVRVSATNDSKAFAAACDESAPPPPSSSNRKPAGGASTFAFGDEISNDEAEALLKRKPLSETKKREICGNKLFSDDPEGGIPSTPERITGAKLVQPPSQIMFGESGGASPRRANTPAEAAKQRDLGGSHETVDDVLWRRASSASKNRELIGNNIFSTTEVAAIHSNEPNKHEAPLGLLAEIGSPGRATTPERKRSSMLKNAELSGNNIFKDDDPKAALDKQLSNLKLKEMKGSNIFSDSEGKPVPRDCLGGVRKPPGGGSTIALV